MSIWCSWREIGYQRLTGGEWQQENGEVRSYATGFSNHYPTTTGDYEQPASVSVASIPSWCVPGVGDSPETFADLGPRLRLDVTTAVHDFDAGGAPTGRYDCASVVLDEAAARALAADLLEWADTPKVHPRKGAA